MTLKKIDTNPIVESVARKNKKFRKYLELKRKGKIIRTQPKLPGLKKGKSVTIKPVGMVFKVEKKFAGGLLGTAIRGAVRSEPGKALFKEAKRKTRELYNKGMSKRSESDKKMLKGLFKVDLKRAKATILQDLMKLLYDAGRKAPKGSGPRKGAAEGVRSYRRLRAYKKKVGKLGEAIVERKAKKIKLNSKGGMQKFNKGGMADYYKDIL